MTKRRAHLGNPCEDIEIEMLDCFLVHGIGTQEMVRFQDAASKPQSRKRKSTALSDQGADQSDRLQDESSQSAVRGVKAGTETAEKVSKADTTHLTLSAKRKAAANKASHATDDATPPIKKCRSRQATELEEDKVEPPSSWEPPKFRMPTALQGLPETERNSWMPEIVRGTSRSVNVEGCTVADHSSLKHASLPRQSQLESSPSFTMADSNSAVKKSDS